MPPDRAPDDPRRPARDLLVLHALRCMGVATLDRLAAALDLPASDVESELIDLGVAGHIRHLGGAVPGWQLTDAGRAEDATRIAAELGSAHATVETAYDAFLVLNPELLQLCTDWQLRPTGGRPVLNDHVDAAYDDAVLRRLVALDRAVDPILTTLTGALGRFSGYRRRLSDARVRAEAGDVAAVADHLESYHSVWFQLHEDLLATLARPRW